MESQLKSVFVMEDGEGKGKKKNKTGPLKSTPGFLKCMRNVYLYFKEEKEKGALNIPINSFIERTAVACGVGRKTLYNYAKKGLFDEHPTLLQPKQKKKRNKLKVKAHAAEEPQITKRGRKKASASVTNNAGSSSTPAGYKNKTSPPRIAKNAMIQTDIKPILANETICLQTATPETDNGFSQFMITRDQSKGQQIHIVQQNKIRETTTIIPTSWLSATNTNIKRDVDYFTKNNIAHTVYSIQTAEPQPCNNDLNGAKIGACQQQTTTDHLTDL